MDVGQVVRPMTRAECQSRLAGGGIGRVILSAQALPTAVAVHFAIDGTDIVFRWAEPVPFSGRSEGSVVAFEVDEFDEVRQEGWTVVVTGVATPADGQGERGRTAALDVGSWIAPSGGELVRLPTTLITGRVIESDCPRGCRPPGGMRGAVGHRSPD
jgi:hypothetical protein